MSNEKFESEMLKGELFSMLNQEESKALLEQSQILHFKKGDILQAEGEDGSSIYYILEGRFSVYIQDLAIGKKILAEVGEHEVVGESAFFFNKKRGATVSSETDSVVLEIGIVPLENLMQSNSTFRKAFKQISIDRMKENFSRLFFNIYFQEFNEELVKRIMKETTFMMVLKGEPVLKEGEISDDIYFLVRGRLKSKFIDPYTKQESECFFTAGETVGELGAITTSPMESSIVATRNSFLLKLSRRALNGIRREYPIVTDKILQIISHRLKHAYYGSHRFPKPKTITLVPLDETINVKKFADRLTKSFCKMEFTAFDANIESINRMINIENLSLLSIGDPQYIQLNYIFNRLEKDHDYLVLSANHNPQGWTQFCIENADEIILIADATKPPTLTRVEKLLIDYHPDDQTAKRLILLQPKETKQPVNTSKWLHERHLILHHHIMEDMNDYDISRVARFISNGAIGVVLGGGGARGNAHIGVIEALIDSKIPIDYVCGTSHGALVAAMVDYCRFNPEAVEKFADVVLKKFAFDITLPMVSLISGKKLESTLNDVFGDLQIEDLWTPFFCVSSNLTRSEPFVHNKGRLGKALRASTSIPGIFPPVVHNGDILVDGGLINNLPINLMRDYLRGGSVIASSVNPKIEMEKNHLPNLSLSGWRLLLQKLKLFPSRVSIPNIASLLIRSGTVASTYEQNLQENLNDNDLIIKPDVIDFELLKYDQIALLKKNGYSAAKDSLSALKSRNFSLWKSLTQH